MKGKNLFLGLFWFLYVLYGIMDSRGWIMQKGFLWSLQPLLLFLGMIGLLLYANIRWLIPRLLQRKRYAGYAAGLLLLLVAYTVLRSLNQQFWDTLVWPKDRMAVTDYFYWNVGNAVWFITITTMLFYAQKWYEQRQQIKNIQISQLETELKYLRAQVNPHFLFNGLNTIYGTVDRENGPAREMIVQFADLLRYHLYDADTERIELDKEAGYLRNYVAIQRARSEARIRIDLGIGIAEPGRTIAPLLFISFLENAFKYVATDQESGGYVSISLNQENDRVSFTIENSIGNTGTGDGGIGLANVRRRLDLLYPGNYSLAIRSEGGVFFVNLTLTIS